jgi:hypothetical protein
MAAEDYRSAQLVFGWSFYRQGSSGGTSSANEFVDEALAWFGDPDPRIGTAWEKGERLAKLVAHRRTLLVLDGLEPLQNPPGPQEGRVRDPSLEVLLRELAALNDMHALAVALWHAGWLAYYERNPAEVGRLASDVIELSTRQTFALWLAGGEVLRGWACSASGDTTEGISWIGDGIRDYRATGSTRDIPFLLALKAEALYLAGRTSEALESIREAEALVERSEGRCWCADLHRLRGVFLAAVGADESQIEASFCAAIRTARDQKSISLATPAEATDAEYRRQKASGLGGRGFRLPLC